MFRPSLLSKEALGEYYVLCHIAGGAIAATPNDSSAPGKSGNTEFTDGSNGAQGKSSSSLDRLLAMHLDNQLACRD